MHESYVDYVEPVVEGSSSLDPPPHAIHIRPSAGVVPEVMPPILSLSGSMTRSVGSRSRHYEEEYPRSRSPFGDSRRPRDEGEARRTRDGSSTQLRWQLPPPRDREKHSRVAALRHEDSDSAEEVETTRAAVIESGKGSQASSHDRPRYKYVEFKKLLSMVDNEHAKQAWPDNAKFSKVCQDFIIRPLDKQNQIWAEDTCKFCYRRPH